MGTSMDATVDMDENCTEEMDVFETGTSMDAAVDMDENSSEEMDIFKMGTSIDAAVDMDENGSQETDIFEMEPQLCAGITAKLLRRQGWMNKQMQGFRHEVAASLRNKATIISQTKEWEFDSSVDGILHDGNTGKVNYVIEKIAHDTPVPSDANIDYCIVRSYKCTVLSNELVMMKGALCQCCNRRLRNLRDRCNAAVNNRKKEEGSKRL
eukprot:scaffold6319_cov29-Attheya_sp.AAC.1